MKEREKLREKLREKGKKDEGKGEREEEKEGVGIARKGPKTKRPILPQHHFGTNGPCTTKLDHHAKVCSEQGVHSCTP